MDNAQQLADRYAAAWTLPDAAARAAAIAGLWVEDGVHYVGTREARGYAALAERVRGSYEKNVRDAGNTFRARRDARQLRDVVTFTWEMVPAGSDEVLAVGLEFLQVDPSGRIVADYQFIIA